MHNHPPNQLLEPWSISFLKRATELAGRGKVKRSAYANGRSQTRLTLEAGGRELAKRELIDYANRLGFAPSEGDVSHVKGMFDVLYPPVDYKSNPLRKVCAWCQPGVSGPDITHGICEHHQRELLAEAGIGGDPERGPDRQTVRLTVHRYDHDTGAMKKVSTYHDTWEEAEMSRRFLKKKLGRSFTGADIELEPNTDHPMHAKINPAGKRYSIINIVDDVARSIDPRYVSDVPAIRQAINDHIDAMERQGFKVPSFNQDSAVRQVKNKVLEREGELYHENPKGRVRQTHHWKTYEKGEHSGAMELARSANPRRVRRRLAAQYLPGHAPKLGRIKKGPYRPNPVHPDGIDPFDRAGLEVGGVRISAWRKPGTSSYIAFIAAEGSNQIDMIRLDGRTVNRDSLSAGIPLSGLKGWKPVTEVPDELHYLIHSHVKAIREGI